MRSTLVILAILCRVAAAQPTDKPPDGVDKAKLLYAEGKRYYDLGDYPHAIDTWKQAYVLAAAPLAVPQNCFLLIMLGLLSRVRSG